MSQAPRPLQLGPERGLIFRITHINNVAHILDHGIRCRNSRVHNPHFVNIGNPDLIDKRNRRIVPRSPGGTLSDYVPFYFTPHSIMLMNIKSGYNGITKQKNEDIVIMASSLVDLIKEEAPVLFTDRHAYCEGATFYKKASSLDKIDWDILRARDFRRDLDDPGKLERYQAEALIHRVLPTSSIKGIGCFNDAAMETVESLVNQRKLDLRVIRRPGWYF